MIGKAAHLGPGPYRNPNVLYDAKAIATNNIHTGSMRGFGTPQAIYAMENAMDELAEKLGMSPLELRRKTHCGPATAPEPVKFWTNTR